MYAFEIDLFPNESDRESKAWDEFIDELEWWLAALLHGGNILSDWQVVELETHVQIRVTTPEKDSLELKYFSQYSGTFLQEMETLTSRPAQFRLVGKISILGDCCSCENPSGYVLQTSGTNVGLPVDCWDCGSTVPLYKLPFLEGNDSHWPLYTWQKSYAHLDGVYMDSFVGERMAYHQLSNPRSLFMRYTRGLAKDLEKATGKPFYSYLMHTYENWGDLCPLCKRGWRVGKGEDDYEFECEHCRILAPEATSSAEPLSGMHA